MFLEIPVELLNFYKILRSYKIKIIEDAANVLEAGIKKTSWNFGDFGVISFNGNKIITSGGGEASFTKKFLSL